MKDRISELAKSVEAEVISHRNHLHKYPEIGFEEKETSAYICAVLDKYDVPYSTVEGCYSVVARLKGQKPGKTIALRADIDALPIQEENDVPYRSNNAGVMHACGHDGHTACLLGLAKIFSENPDLIEGEVVFIFQHAEENPPGGAIVLVKSGLMEDVDVIFGAHLWARSDTGIIHYNKNALMASMDRFDITLRGIGGHGASPHETTDSLLAGTMLVQQLQSIISREVHATIPAVLSVCYINSGTTFNIIPDYCNLGGTVRTCDEDTRTLIKNRIREIAKGTAATYNLTCELNYEDGYPVLICHADTVEKAVDGISKLTQHQLLELSPVMGGEDFAYYTIEKPGAFFFVGCRNEEKGIVYPHHNSRFNIDERALGIMVETLLAAYLTESSNSNGQR